MQTLMFGLISGALLAVAASGFALLRITERFLHIAHGQFMALGGFLGIVLAERLGLVVGILAAVLVTAVAGALVGQLLFEPLRRRASDSRLFTSVGLAFIVYALMILLFGSQLRVFDLSLGRGRDVGPVSIAPGEVAILVVAFLIIGGLWTLLTRTSLGRSIRAVASNVELAEARGVNVRNVSRLVWLISSGLAAVAGILLGMLTSVSTEMGWTNILLILAAAVMGGMGNILGVVAAAVVLTVVMDLSTLVLPSTYRPVVAFSILILVLLVRPQGLFATASRREVAT